MHFWHPVDVDDGLLRLACFVCLRAGAIALKALLTPNDLTAITAMVEDNGQEAIDQNNLRTA